MIDNDEDITIKFKVKFNENIEEPIFAMSIKDFRGLELLGTNTEIENKKTGNYKKGEEVTVEYKLKIPLAPNRYAISLGCTKIHEDGNLEVFDRKYDSILIEITSQKPIGGLVRIQPQIEITK
jgi:teichoic acid transport system ATP-binding protein